MRVVIPLEYRFDRTPDGAVWTQTVFAYPFWKRYLAIFDQVRVVARIREVPAVPPEWKRADGEAVSFAAVPYYVGPWQYLKRMRQIGIATREAVGSSDAVILRVGSQIAATMAPIFRRNGRPFGVEVVHDPYDLFAPGAVEHPLRPIFRWWFTTQLRRQCAAACAAAYVTEHALQRRYPPASSAFTTHYSSVELGDDAFVSRPRRFDEKMQTFTLISVGTLEQLYKGPDLLIEAVNVCVSRGLDIRVLIVGDGKHRQELEAQAQRLGLSDRICFLGWVSAGEALRRQLDRADLFVLPSKQEGVPRAMLEAMARALPCIGTTVGGIPELLAAEDMVVPGNVQALAQKIIEVLESPERMTAQSARNLNRAKVYKDNILQERRLEFFGRVREKTEAWLGTQTR